VDGGVFEMKEFYWGGILDPNHTMEETMRGYLNVRETLVILGVSSACIFCLVFLVGSAIFTHEVPYRIDLKSLNDGSEIQGHFFLGSGSIRQEPQFVAYAKTARGGYVLKTFPADMSTIYMDSWIPYVVVWHSESDFIVHSENGISAYDFHVPPGTIVEKYVLDGQL